MRRVRLSPSRLGSLLLAALTVALPLMRGGVDLIVEAVAVACSLIVVALACGEGAGLPRIAAPMIAVLCFVVLQLVPVPAAVHTIAPGAVRIFEVSLAPLGAYPASRPLSLDPPGTARELAKGIGCLSAFLAAWLYSEHRRRRERIVHGLAFSSAAVSAAVLGLALLGAGDLVAPRVPFVNPNHLAAFLNLTGFVALGLAFRTHGHSRVLWGIAFVTAGAVVFLSLSRGGIGAFFVGAAVFVALHFISRARETAPTQLPQVLLIAAVAGAVAVAAFLALDPIVAEMRTVRGATNDLKVRLVSTALQLIREFPLTGIGPGAFVSVFPAYQSESSSITFTHLENEWVQAVVDLGMPAGILLVATFVWIWVIAARRKDLSPTHIGLLAGTAALGVHNVFDFSLHVLGVALPFAIGMGLLARGSRPLTVRPATLIAIVAFALFVVGGSIAIAATHDLDADRDRVERASGAAATADAARAALLWHPADWVAQATAGARLASTVSCRDGLPWLLRAMTLDPGAPAPHLVSARCLARGNDAAAKREYRLAIMYGLPVLAEAARTYPAVEDLFQIAPDTPDGLLLLGAVLTDAERPNDAATAYERLIEVFSDDRGLLPLGRLRLSQDDADSALALARRFSSRYPADPSGWLVAARALHRLGRLDDARAEAERGLAATPGAFPLLRFMCEAAISERRWSEAKRLAEEIAPRTANEIAGKHLLVAQALAGQGRMVEALESARSAAAADPDSHLLWYTLAEYARHAGRLDDAVAALRHAGAMRDAPPDHYAAKIEQLEAAQNAERERLLERGFLRGTPAEANRP